MTENECLNLIIATKKLLSEQGHIKDDRLVQKLRKLKELYKTY